uniref:Uncharacterized protein n=1 Tax=Panagrolaimus sp. JU765 TaxID=591449 RepID=A0AC34RH15_9BILA
MKFVLLLLFASIVYCDWKHDLDLYGVRYFQPNRTVMIDRLLFDNEKQNFTVDKDYNVHHDNFPNNNYFRFNLVRRYKNEKHVGYSLVACFFLASEGSLHVHCYYFESKNWTKIFTTSCSYPKTSGTPYLRDIPSNGSDIHLLVYFYDTNKEGCKIEATNGSKNESKIGKYSTILTYDAFSGKTYKVWSNYYASIFNSVCMTKTKFIHQLIKYGENQTVSDILPRHHFFFDYNQAGKPITSFYSKFLTTVKLSTKGGICQFDFTNVKTSTRNESFQILCYPDDPEVSFGLMRNFDDKFRLWACFLIYKNYSPVLFCHVLNDSRVFAQEFFYRFQNCKFDCDVDKCGKELNYTPNIMIGNFYGKSKVLNGITINFGGESCHLEVKNGGKIVNESRGAIEYHGYDAINDKMLSHTDGSIGAIISVTNELFVKGANSFWSRYDFPEDSIEAFALIDEKWFSS